MIQRLRPKDEMACNSPVLREGFRAAYVKLDSDELVKELCGNGGLMEGHSTFTLRGCRFNSCPFPDRSAFASGGRFGGRGVTEARGLQIRGGGSIPPGSTHLITLEML